MSKASFYLSILEGVLILGSPLVKKRRGNFLVLLLVIGLLIGLLWNV